MTPKQMIDWFMSHHQRDAYELDDELQGHGWPSNAVLDEVEIAQRLRKCFAKASDRDVAVAAAALASERPLDPRAVDVDDLVRWFGAQHSRAVDESPWDGREGGYLYPTLDEDGIGEILLDAFPLAPPEVIAAAAVEIAMQDEWLDPEFRGGLDPDGRDAMDLLMMRVRSR
jgi:hypothetical protein